MNKALVRTDFNFPGQESVYHGKVRDVYDINGKILPKGIPYKGQVLNMIASKFLDATADIVGKYILRTP